MSDYDATVVGAGPNGLVAALELARAGRRTLLVEGSAEIGGGTRTEELTLPGYLHDVCSAIHPAGVASPFFTEIELEVDWVQPPIPFSHPLDGGRAVSLHRSVEETAEGLGRDGDTYSRLMTPLVENIAEFVDVALGPVTVIPEHPGAFARIGMLGGLPAALLVKRFKTDEGRALISGIAAHAIAPFHSFATSAVGLMLGAIGHSHGWPLVKGGSQQIARELAARFQALGGTIEVGRTVTSLDEIPADLYFLDVMPPAALAIAGSAIDPSSIGRLQRWKPGPGVFKVDWALDEPIPWRLSLFSRIRPTMSKLR